VPDETPYNPLDKSRLGESVAKALLTQPVSPLPPQKQFDGADIREWRLGSPAAVLLLDRRRHVAQQ
jgi:hypothetical protein